MAPRASSGDGWGENVAHGGCLVGGLGGLHGGRRSNAANLSVAAGIAARRVCRARTSPLSPIWVARGGPGQVTLPHGLLQLMPAVKPDEPARTADCALVHEQVFLPTLRAYFKA